MRVATGTILTLLGLYLLGTGVLATTLYRVQVNDVAEFRKRLEHQATRRIGIPGRRGRILDREGHILADSKPQYDLVCRLEYFQHAGGWSNTVSTIEAEIARLAAVIRLPHTLTPEGILRHLQRSSALPLTVWQDVPNAALARFVERALDFPGFEEVLRAKRVYPNGTYAAHLLGYTGRGLPDIDAGEDIIHYYEELELKGRSGVEGYYDGFLTGVAGERLVRVNARGFRKDDGIVEREPAHGPDLHLTISLPIQKALEDALDGVLGAGVVLDPRDGAVLALASTPTFNPGTWKANCSRWLNDSTRPLYNRAISGVYPPGSIFKPITALSALMYKHTNPAFTWSPYRNYDCIGVYTLGTMHLRCWDRYGHGPITLREAIQHSCNVYFCGLGQSLGTNALFTTARAFGLASRTGIDLNGEAAGTISKTPWYAGNLCQTAIGQGYLQVTPIQMAVVAATLANGGRVYRPYLHKRTGAPVPQPVRTLACRPEEMELVRRGMYDVVEIGTGRRIRMRYAGDTNKRYVVSVPCAGKTGTAERGRGVKDTWITAFAPYDKPTVAMAIVVENGESGGLTTAPRAQQVLARVFGETEMRP